MSPAGAGGGQEQASNVDVCGGGAYLTSNHPANGGKPSCIEPAELPVVAPVVA